MNVLLVNNRYTMAGGGGAMTVALQTQALLEDGGHEVIPFAMREAQTLPTPWSGYFPTREELSLGSAYSLPSRLLGSVYSFPSRQRLEELLRRVRPDVAHLHDLLWLLTLSVVDALWEARIPMVMTLHDYRAVCPNARLLTHDGICQRCLPDGQFWNAVRHRCLGSRTYSLVFALESYLNRFRRQYDKIDRFIAPSRFLRDVMVSAGLPATRIEVVPNAMRAAAEPARAPASPARFIYFGRLAREKGLEVLLEASRSLAADARIVIFGEDGLLQQRLPELIKSERLPIEFRGYATRPAIFAELATATAAVLPAIWHENCSMAILEAAAHAVATIGTQLGGTPELISHDESGLVVPAGDAAALAAAMNELADDPARAAALGRRAWQQIKDRHGPEAHLSSIIFCYQRAVTASSAFR